ncbi:MAG: glycosyltransferase, partial [Bacteroidota bacterium]
QLAYDGLPFRLIVLGTSTNKYPPIFDEAKEKLKDHIFHFGEVETLEEYAQLLDLADIGLCTSYQDFFGISVVESIFMNCHPILPNRLAYPEHIPDQYSKEVFYSNEQEMKRKVIEAIYRLNIIRSRDYSSWVSHYDWNQLIDKYDKVLEIN